MIKCEIAEFNIKFQDDEDLLSYRLISHRSDFEKPDIEITVSKTDTDNEFLFDNKKLTRNRGYYAEIAAFRKLAEVLPLYDAFVLHSAVIDVDGVGIAFAARSGTGKTTHLLNWQKFLKDKVAVVNGDKPIVRFFDGLPFAYGTPWLGKEKMGTDIKSPLKHICFITRSEKNETVKLDKSQFVERIMNQVFIPNDSKMLSKTLSLIDKLLQSVNIWEIRCNKDVESAEVAFNAIFGAQTENLPKRQDILKENNSRVFQASYIPAYDTKKFEIKLPFKPKKIIIFCNDAFSCESPEKCYFVNLLIDFSSTNYLVNGIIADSKPVTLAFWKDYGLFSISDNNVFCIDSFSRNDKFFYFSGSKKYTFFAIE